MLFNFINSLNCTNEEGRFLNAIVENLEELKSKIEGRLEELNSSKNQNLEKGELYFVYAYTPPNVYVTRQGSSKVELLNNVTDEFKKNLAEGFILRYKNGVYTVDEALTEKSMNFELDFDNYKE